MKKGGIIIIHDAWKPAVWKACRYLETNKPYERIAPLTVYAPKVIRLLRRIKRLEEAKLRRTKWHSLAAFKKAKDVVSDKVCFRNF